MRHLAREDIVRELTFTGRIFSGEEAYRYGFATRLCADPYAEAMATAREIAGKSPDAIRAAKRILNQAVLTDVESGLTQESVEQGRLIGSKNQVEAVMANLQKRDPNFVDA
jgi:enoyl-CoA hydratase/carnithine racemase